MASDSALDGLRVVESGHTTAASYLGKLLSDLGACVVKLEDASDDPARWSGRFLYLNTGKQSVVIDQDPMDQILRFAADADVLITDETTNALVPPELPAHLIWCSVSPYGLTGPYSGYQGVHLTVYHAGGEGQLIPSGTGWEMFPDRPPVQLGSDICDYDTGANATVAVLAACLRKAVSGRGGRIDVSAQESQLTLNRTRLSRFNHDGIELRRGPSRYGIGGMIRCRDGYVQLVGITDDHWTRLAAAPEGTAFAAVSDESDLRSQALRDWCAGRDKAEVTRFLAGAGCPVGAYATPADLVASEQLRERSFFQQVDQPGVGTITLPGVPYRLSRTPVTLRPAPELGIGGRFPPSTHPGPAGEASSPRPLAGTRVLDFTWAAAGPYATLLLAWLGAEVIKVESSRRLDPARRGFMDDYGGVNRSPNFDELNLNKRSFVVDLTQAAGLALVKRLVAVSDVVVDNFRPGVMARYGLDAASLLAERPTLIVASSSANGSTGPEAAGAGLASVFGATGGLGEQTGYPDGPPSEVGESTDYRSANAFTIAILAAIIHRQRTGEGQAIDLASREVVIATAPDALLAHLTGAEWQPRLGNEHRQLSPHSVYPCLGTDEWLAIAVRDEREWAALCQILEQPQWESAFSSPESRVRQQADIDRVIAAWSSRMSAQEAFHLLQARGIPSAPSFTNKQLATDPHLAARKVFAEVDHPEIGRHRVMRAPWVISGTDCSIDRHGPLLGQDNRYVLETILDIPVEEQAQFVEVFR